MYCVRGWRGGCRLVSDLVGHCVNVFTMLDATWVKGFHCLSLGFKLRLLHVVGICQFWCRCHLAWWLWLRSRICFRCTRNRSEKNENKKNATHWRFLSSVRRRCSLISTMSSGKPCTQSIPDRYEVTSPIPSFPRWMWSRWPVESWQSSSNIVSNRRLKVLCAVSRSPAFITHQILSSFVPSRIDCGRVFERDVIFLTWSLICCRFILSGNAMKMEWSTQIYWMKVWHSGKVKIDLSASGDAWHSSRTNVTFVTSHIFSLCCTHCTYFIFHVDYFLCQYYYYQSPGLSRRLRLWAFLGRA